MKESWKDIPGYDGKYQAIQREISGGCIHQEKHDC